MKKILILVALITAIEISVGDNSVASKSNQYVGATDQLIATNTKIIEPRFTELKGNLFLVLDLEQNINLDDGTVVEFDFGRKNQLVSFHVNDVNQTIVDAGEAEVLVMIHEDLALELKNERLMKIRIKEKSGDIMIRVNERWVPDQHIVSL